MGESVKTYRCIYCDGPAKIREENGKSYLDCKNCGKRECTKLLIARLEQREIK